MKKHLAVFDLDNTIHDRKVNQMFENFLSDAKLPDNFFELRKSRHPNSTLPKISQNQC